MLIKFGGVQPKLFPDWLNGSATTTVHLVGYPGPDVARSATRVAAGGADTAGRFPSVVCIAWPLAEFSSFRPEAKVFACGMTCSSNRLRWRRTSSARSRTAADSWPRPGLAGRSTSLTLNGVAQGATAHRGFYVLTLSARVGLLIGARHRPGPRRSACRGWTAQWYIDWYPRHQLGCPISNVLAAECSRGR
jgi:hypothetical protein